MTQTLHQPKLRQHGRASVNFMVQLGQQAAPVIKRVGSDMAARNLSDDSVPDDLDQRNEVIEAALADSQAYSTQKLMGDWFGRVHADVAIKAYEAVEDELTPVLKAAETGPATLTLDPNFEPPAYWDGVHFHRTAGGWEGHPQMGYIHGEIIFKQMISAQFDVLVQRKKALSYLPHQNFRRILEMGCSNGHFTIALAHTMPEAKITGVDLSASMLKHALRTANLQGWDWDLYQRPAENTGFADASFDLVSSYILLHELPKPVIEQVFAEALRVLEPGGTLMMSDVTRYADMDKLAQWKVDRGARHGGEPYWRESASLDLAAVAREAGFENAVADGTYPHVLIANKPL